MQPKRHALDEIPQIINSSDLAHSIPHHTDCTPNGDSPSVGMVWRSVRLAFSRSQWIRRVAVDDRTEYLDPLVRVQQGL